MNEHAEWYLRGKDDQRSEDRVAAFGAIRRAAEVARRHHHKHTAYEEEHGASWASPGKCESAAIRHAIRIAIGSHKATSVH